MPTGVRMPVASMSVRALIGIVQELATPGNFSAASISAMSLSVVMPSRHSSSGLRLMTVSNISSGAGSVAVRARPALPNTDSTSGKPLMIRSCCCSSSDALVTDMPGSDAGMYSSVPSLSVGMNSLPRRDAGHRLANRATSANMTVAMRCRRTTLITGR